MIRATRLVWFRLLLAGTSAWLAGAPAAASPPLAEAYRALARPALGELFDLPGGSIHIGRAELKPAAGVRARALLADGRVCGLLFEGEVTLHYLVDDAFSVPVARRNLKPQSAIVPRAEGQGFAFSLALSGAAIWGPDPALAQAPASVAPGARLPAWLTEILARKVGGNPSRDLLISERNGEPGYRWAALHTAGDDYLLDFDPRRAVRTESLARLRRVDGDVKIYGGRLEPGKSSSRNRSSRPGGTRGRSTSPRLRPRSSSPTTARTMPRSPHESASRSCAAESVCCRSPWCRTSPTVTTASAVSSSSR